DRAKTKLALLMEGNHALRNESVISVNFGQRVSETCVNECEILYNEADGRSSTQRHQAEVALRKGAAVLIIDPVAPAHAAPIVEEARKQGVPVIDYGHPIADAEPDVVVAFDAVRVGELQAASLARALARKGKAGGPIVMLVGEPGDRSKDVVGGARRGFETAGIDVAKHYSVPSSDARHAQKKMEDAIAALGKDGFAGVYAETDAIAGGAIAAMEATGIDPAARPTSGRGSSLAGVQRILAGQQQMTVYEPVESYAAVSAQVAVELAEGRGIPTGRVPAENETDTVALPTSGAGVPTFLIESVTVDRTTVEQTVLGDDLFSQAEVCVGAYKRVCKEAKIPWH
ncbi:MAG TPA: substrate-binding domain-containing protein, partial [Solirubrobacterales bacterium]